MYLTLCKYIMTIFLILMENLLVHGGESHDLNDRVHGISCQYSDKTSKRTFHLNVLIPNRFS